MPANKSSVQLLAALLSLSTTHVANATSLTIQEISVAPSVPVLITVTGGVFGSQTSRSGSASAGVVNLVMDGETIDAFCIDPFHRSVKSTLYDVVALSEAPKSGSTYVGPIGAEAAEKIGKLWAMAYSASITAEAAAALQLAIWEVVGGDFFQWNGTGGVYAAAQQLLDDLSSQPQAANLLALRSATRFGQDYVFQIPETGATATLVGLSITALALVRRKLVA